MPLQRHRRREDVEGAKLHLIVMLAGVQRVEVGDAIDAEDEEPSGPSRREDQLLQIGHLASPVDNLWRTQNRCEIAAHKPKDETSPNVYRAPATERNCALAQLLVGVRNDCS
jgi:hypothetical protein